MLLPTSWSLPVLHLVTSPILQHGRSLATTSLLRRTIWRSSQAVFSSRSSSIGSVVGPHVKEDARHKDSTKAQEHLKAVDDTRKLRRKRFTDDEDRLLIERYKSGVIPRDIAHEVDRRTVVVWRRLKALASLPGLGLVVRGRATSQRRFSPEDDSIISSLKAANKSWIDIGDRLGRSGHSVRVRFYQTLQYAGPFWAAARQRVNEPWTSSEAATLKRMRDAGTGWTDIGIELQRLPSICVAYWKDVIWTQSSERSPSRWSPQEDSKLQQFEGSSSSIGKQCSWNSRIAQ